jgi:hypothetical protein
MPCAGKNTGGGINAKNLERQYRYHCVDGIYRTDYNMAHLWLGDRLMQKIFLRPALVKTFIVEGLAIAGTLILGQPFGIPDARAHGGRTAADGCHNDRKNGGRHCHGGKAAPKKQIRANGSVYYPNCSAARAAGAAPVRRGQPGYASHLDRDNDGIGCE